jgi:AbrB family looped-hinge helix DNA binding protein
MGTEHVGVGMRISAKVIESGRVTIPATVREQYGLETGDYVMIDVRPMEDSNE